MEEELLKTPAAESVIEMGYNKSAIRMAIIIFRERDGRHVYVYLALLYNIYLLKNDFMFYNFILS